MSIKSILKIAVPALLATAVSASAATIDFTTNSLTTTATGFSGSSGAITFTLDGSPTAAIMGDSAPASAAADLASVGLAGDFDGIGIKNDEVNGAEFLTLTFDREVKITGVFFLDLYISRKDATDFETAGMDNGSTTLNFDAQEVFSNDALGGGFGNFATSMKGQTFTFFDVAGNDNIGEGDFALAGLTITSVPLPAGVLLLGTALGGLGLTRRRKAIVKA